MSTGAPNFQDIANRKTPTGAARPDTHVPDETPRPAAPEETRQRGALGKKKEVPARFVRVRVQRVEDKYTLNLHHCNTSKVVYPKPCPRPGDLLGKIDKDPEHVNVLSKLQDLNQQEPLKSLVKQLLDLLEVHHDLCLVLEEDVSLGVPWEMIYSPTKKAYLGALVTTVRWPFARDEESADDEAEDRLARDPETCSGSVLFLASSDLPAPNYEPSVKSKVFAHIDAMQALDTLMPRDFGSLAVYLWDPQPGVGLIYLLCHGNLLRDNQKSWVGTADESVRVKYEDLNANPLELLEESRSIVFINACAVGSLQETAGGGERALSGFPPMFLRKGARGFIGALHRVDVRHAVDMANKLLALAETSPATPVPELLRTLREEADTRLKNARAAVVAAKIAQARQKASAAGAADDAARAADDAAARAADDAARAAELELNEAVASWYNTYLYVYYGDPQASLQVVKRGGGA